METQAFILRLCVSLTFRYDKEKKPFSQKEICFPSECFTDFRELVQILSA